MPATAPTAAARPQPSASIQPTRMPTRRLDSGFCAAAHPRAVLVAATRSLPRLAFSTLPRSLGPAGLVGCLACAALFLSRAESRRRLLLAATPCLTLLLLLFTFPNDRVAGTMVPFLLVLAATGLAAMSRRIRMESRPRRVLA